MSGDPAPERTHVMGNAGAPRPSGATPVLPASSLWIRGWRWLAGPQGLLFPALLLGLGLLWMRLVPPAPPPADPAYGIWVAHARLRFGPLFDLGDRLGLWSLPETPGWRLLWAALGWSVLVHAVEAGRARRTLAALSMGLFAAAIGIGGLGRYLPPPRTLVLAPGEGAAVDDFRLTLEEEGLSLWHQGDLIGRTGFRPALPFRLGPYGGVAWRAGAVLEAEAAGPSGPLMLRAALDAPPTARLRLWPSPEGEAFAALPEAHWILRVRAGRELTIFEEGTGQVVGQELLPSLADGQGIERSLPGGYLLRLTARPLYRLTLFPFPVFLQRALSVGLAALGGLLGGIALLRAALPRR